MDKFFLSSTGSGVKLRLKAFVLLLVPALNELLKAIGVQLMPEQVELFVDSVFYIWFAIAEVWGWVRAYWR